MGNLPWGILERFHSFPYKLTSVNGEVEDGGLNVSGTIVVTEITFIFGDFTNISTQKCKIWGKFMSLYERFIRNLRMIKFNS